MSRNSPARLLVLLAVSACGDSAGPAHTPHPMDYYVAFPANTDLSTTDATLSLVFAGRPGVTGSVALTTPASVQGFTIDGNGQYTLSVPAGHMLTAWDSVLPRGIRIHTDDSVSVLAVNEKPSSMAPAVVLPATSLGTSHRVLAGAAGAVRGSFLTVVGTANATIVTITPSATAGARAAGTPFQVTLGLGTAYQLAATDSTGDLTGSVVTADKPVAVYAGHIFGQVPGGTCCAGMLWTAIPPISALAGTDFYLVRFNQRTQYWVRVVGLQDGTNLTVAGISGMATTINAGQSAMAIGTSDGRIVATHPILVAQLAEGQLADNVAGSDPCLTLVAPASAFAKGYAFATPISQVGVQYVNLVVPTGSVGRITLDDTTVSAGVFVTMGSTGYARALVPLVGGINTVASSGGAFGAMAYGWDANTGANGFCLTPGGRF